MSKPTHRALITRVHLLRPGTMQLETRAAAFQVEDLSDDELMRAGYPPGATRAAGAPGPGLQALRDAIEPLIGGIMERVSVLWQDRPADMFVHETGRLDGLPRNDLATDVYRAAWLKRHPGIDPETLVWIAGNAVIFADRVWF